MMARRVSVSLSRREEAMKRSSGKPEERHTLPKNFRKLSVVERREKLRALCGEDTLEWDAISSSPELLELADLMVESAVGWLPVPLGIVTGLLVDGRKIIVPLAVEEPSVVAAASYAGSILARSGGLTTWATDPLMETQVFLEEVTPEGETAILSQRRELQTELEEQLTSLTARGGGFRKMEVSRLPESGLVRVQVTVDVQDAMGANILNTAAESLKPRLESISGGKALMAILSNAAVERRAGARFSLPLERLAPLAGSGFSAAEIGRRIALACTVAGEDESRAVTHNKGIMNGITSLALATGNDARAIEAAAHAWAGRTGRYRPLSRFSLSEGALEGELELPLAFASVGGAVGFHPATRLCLKLLGNPDGRSLARLAAAVGLVQNFAALLALVTEGIQKGHMKLHATRLAYLAGARGREIQAVADRLSREGAFRLGDAQRILNSLRELREKQG
jgi:hydroxymethylglutaryl-CoA reductase